MLVLRLTTLLKTQESNSKGVIHVTAQYSCY